MNDYIKNISIPLMPYTDKCISVLKSCVLQLSHYFISSHVLHTRLVALWG
jgi:hypothetical protein